MTGARGTEAGTTGARGTEAGITGARGEVLERIRSALGPAPVTPEVPRDYAPAGAVAPDVDRFCERVADYRATVHRVTADELAAAVAEACRRLGARRVGTTLDLAVDGVELVADDPPLSVADLDGLDAVLTGCALGVAETGTLALDGGAASGRRALTLVPDVHLCVIEAAQVVATVPDAVAALAEAATAGRPVTLVSGPSATSDIELDRVEGVHGPRTLEVFVVGGAATAH
jgi:L-lactate dehydrogenase complex protein LldG